MKKMLNLVHRYWLVASVLCLLAGIAQPALAQGDPSGRVARLNYIQGDVSFQPGGETDWVWASLNRPFTSGDSIWTGVDSRAELHVGSSAIRVGQQTAVSFLNIDDGTIQIQLNSGSLAVRIRHLYRDEVFEIDTPNVAVTLLQPGNYRVDTDPNGDFTSVTVRDGEGQINGGGQAFDVDPGSQAQVSGTNSLDYNIYDLPQQDEFDQWAGARDQSVDRSQSARYVSPEVTGYEDLDQNGTWSIDPQLGPIWTPNQVSWDWAPYREGHWAWVDPWGWTWVDENQWGFATSHYGRWAHVSNPVRGGFWVWVPPHLQEIAGPGGQTPYSNESYYQRTVYSPANVTFLGGANFGSGGAVAWFPLAPGEVYVPSYTTSTTYINQLNVTNTNVQTTYITTVVNNPSRPVSYANQTVAGAVISVPKAAFVSAQPVAKAAVNVSVGAASAATAVHAVPVAPVKASVLGSSSARAASSAPPPKPPAGVATRQVVAKATPPPPPVPFAAKQQALAANPGKPLDAKTVQSLRASAPPPAPLVMRAPAATTIKAAAALPKKPQPETTRTISPLQPSSGQAVPQGAARQQATPQQAVKPREQQAAPQEAAKPREQQATPPAPSHDAKGQQPNPSGAQSPATSNNSPVHTAENVQATKLVSQPKLNYPVDAKGARLHGTVVVQALIGSDGKVKNATAISGPPALRAAALENARQRVYKPTLVNGQPVEVETQISLNF
jgi:hypothetical protein